MFMARIAMLAAAWVVFPILAGTGPEPGTRPEEAGASVPAAAGGKAEADSPAAPTLDQDYEAIKGQALAEWASIKTLTATLTTTAAFGQPGNRVLRRSVGQYDYRTRDGMSCIRWDTVEMTTIRMEQGDTMMRHRKLIIQDGPAIYILNERSGRSEAEKVAPDSVDLMPLGGPEFFEMLERYFYVKGRKSGSLDGRPVHVIAARPKWGDGIVFYYIDTATGLLLKRHTGNASGDNYETTRVTGVDRAKAFGEDHFHFIPPAGVEVHDTTTEAAPNAPIHGDSTDTMPERKERTDPE